MTPIALIPHYNHGKTLATVCAALRAYELPVLIIDDGSQPADLAAARELAGHDPAIHLLERTHNGGKGAAVKDGIHWAAQHGYSHALQIDADGQHDFADIPRFLAAGQAHPDALICGSPAYSTDAPKSRLYGRKISNFWIWVNTGSRDIPDGMCGYRLYPVAATVALLRRHHIGNRMDFDIEILVQHYRLGTPLHWITTRVRYPADGRSHFRLWRDNLRISVMHARLFFSGLLWRLRRP
jgi:group 2 family glycosyl transferase